MEELLINGKDAYSTWGVKMGNGFIDTISGLSSLKPFIENKSRLEHGKRVIIKDTKIDEKEITLSFTIRGVTSEDFKNNKKLFLTELYKGTVDIQIPMNSSDVYHLIYLGKSVSYSQNINRTFAKFSAKFCEPNPNNRV